MEAIYYFCLDFHALFSETTYAGEFDDLLFYFKFMYNTIKNLYNGGKYIKAYQKDEGKKEGKEAEGSREMISEKTNK